MPKKYLKKLKDMKHRTKSGHGVEIVKTSAQRQSRLEWLESEIKKTKTEIKKRKLRKTGSKARTLSSHVRSGG